MVYLKRKEILCFLAGVGIRLIATGTLLVESVDVELWWNVEVG